MRKNTQQNNGTSVELRDFTVTFEASLIVKGDCGFSEKEIREAWSRGEIAFGRSDYDENARAECGCAYLGDQHVGYYVVDEGVLGTASRFMDMLRINDPELTL